MLIGDVRYLKRQIKARKSDDDFNRALRDYITESACAYMIRNTVEQMRSEKDAEYGRKDCVRNDSDSL